MNTIKVSDTRYPRLTRAILRSLDREQLRDVANHGADAGWSGFTYYSDTCAFYKAHKADILDLAKQSASDIGEDMLAMIARFGCLRGAPINGTRPQQYETFSATEIGEAIFSGRGENADTIRNAMVWFALEEVARELNPDL